MSNPYITFDREPDGWAENNGGKSWEQHKQDVERGNTSWWDKHTADGGFQYRTETPLGVEGSEFPLGVGNKYGPFIHVPFPISGHVKWGFQREEGLKLFLADLAAGTLPKAPKAAPPRIVRKAPAPVAAATGADDDPFAALTAGEPEEDPFAGLTDDAPAPAAAEPEEDPFAALTDDEPSEAQKAVAEPPQAAVTQIEGDDEPETDEWGEVIHKPGKSGLPEAPAADEDDPFALL